MADQTRPPVRGAVRPKVPAEAIALGQGWLGWPGEENSTGRLGVVCLEGAPGSYVAWPQEHPMGRRGVLIVAGEPDERSGIVFDLGAGTLFRGQSEQIPVIGVRPDDERYPWLDSLALAVLHSHRVRLYFLPDPA
jgi:hypothetical protein